MVEFGAAFLSSKHGEAKLQSTSRISVVKIWTQSTQCGLWLSAVYINLDLL